MLKKLTNAYKHLGVIHSFSILSDNSKPPTYVHVLAMLVVILREVSYRDAYKSLAQPGRKPATATKDFDFHVSYL